jgi:fructokinase
MRIGVHLAGDRIVAAALGDDGEIRSRRHAATPVGDYTATISAIAGLVGELDTCRVGDSCRVGIATAAVLSPTSGLVGRAALPWLDGRSLQGDLSSALQQPVRIAHDAACLTLNEAHSGLVVDCAVVFGALLDEQVGGAVAVDGRLMLGPNRLAGGWGYIAASLRETGRIERIEDDLTTPALSREYAQITGREQPITPAEVVARAESGVDDAATATMTRYADRVARALASVVHLLDPDAIVLDGPLQAGEMIRDRVQRRLPNYVVGDAPEVWIVPPSHGADSIVRGAAQLWTTNAPIPEEASDA